MTDYQITLPLGISIGDADTGTYELVSGRTYKCTNIDQEVVAPIVGYTTGESLGVICLSAAINKWAAFKPFRDLGGSQNGKPFNGMAVVVTLGSVYDILEYEKPNDTSGYGLEEFFGYNHAAPSPGVFVDSGGNEVDPEADIYYTEAGWDDLEMWISLPEFDIRDIGSNFDGVVSTVTPMSPMIGPEGTAVFEAITNAMATNKRAKIVANVFFDGTVTYIEFILKVYIGFDPPEDPLPMVNFPHDGVDDELHITVKAWNRAPVTLDSDYTYDVADPPDMVRLDWDIRANREYYQLQRRIANDGINYGSWANIGGEITLLYYEDTDLYTASTVELGGSVQYRVRPIYEVPIPIDYEGWSNTVTEIDIGLATTGGA